MSVLVNRYWLVITGSVLNIYDSYYFASNGKSVAVNQYWRSTEFFVNVVSIRTSPTWRPQSKYRLFSPHHKLKIISRLLHRHWHYVFFWINFIWLANTRLLSITWKVWSCIRRSYLLHKDCILPKGLSVLVWFKQKDIRDLPHIQYCETFVHSTAIDCI